MRKREVIYFVGVFLMLINTIVLHLIFLFAYFNPNKRIIVNINSIGEANIEFILLFMITTIGVITCCIHTQKINLDLEK